MNETAYVSFFVVLRVLLVGGLFLALPALSRKGLVFGAYVGEEAAEGDAVRALVRRWHLGCLALMVLALAVGLGAGLAGRPLVGNYASAAFLLLSGMALYVRMHFAARQLASPEAARQAATSVAPLHSGEPRGAGLARIALVICLLAGVASIVHATVYYEPSPDKLFLSALWFPALNLVICTFVAWLALLTANAKQSLRGGTGGGSAEAQIAFRAAIAKVISISALFTCALMTFISLEISRPGPPRGPVLGVGVMLITIPLLLFTLGSMVRIMSKYGQGGALVERGSPEAPLTDGLADNTHWAWGIFYVNRDDPSFMVEKRFGIGYTINFGNRRAVAMMAVFLVLVFGLMGLGLIVGTP